MHVSEEDVVGDAVQEVQQEVHDVRGQAAPGEIQPLQLLTRHYKPGRSG